MNLMNENKSYSLKIWSNKNIPNFAVNISKFSWFNKFDQIKLTVH